MRDSFQGGEGVPREKPPDGYAREIRAEIGERGCFGDWRLCGEGLENAWRPTNWEEKTAEVKTMYKRKDKKVLPANVPLSGGVNPEGGVSGSVPVMEQEMGSKGDVGETHGGRARATSRKRMVADVLGAISKGFSRIIQTLHLVFNAQ